MNTTTLTKPAAATTLRPLSDAYIELLLQGAQADPHFGSVVLVAKHGDDKAQPLHRGTLKALYNLSGTAADPESVGALADSLRELYETKPTSVQVKMLLELAVRTGDLIFAENQARCIFLASDGSARVEAYGALICFDGIWWNLTGRDGLKFAGCPQLESAVQHARHMQRSTFGVR